MVQNASTRTLTTSADSTSIPTPRAAPPPPTRTSNPLKVADMSYASAFRTSRSPFFGSFFQRLKASPQNQFEAPIKRNLRIRIGRVAKVITPHSPLNQNGPNSELIAPSRHLEVPEGHVRCRTVQNTINRTLPTSAETNSTPTPRPPPSTPPRPPKKCDGPFGRAAWPLLPC